LEQEYIQVGSLVWKDETKEGDGQYNDAAEKWTATTFPEL
jgi:hypothetical protein